MAAYPILPQYHSHFFELDWHGMCFSSWNTWKTLEEEMVNSPVQTQRSVSSVGIEAPGVLDSRMLPDSGYDLLWDSIFVDYEIKTRLLCQGLLNFTLRPHLEPGTIPLHGVMLLTGPPGTGKTTLSKGLASRIAESVTGIGRFQFIETEPHALISAALGKSQRAVRDFLGGTVAEAAANGPVVVLLDEVETLAVDRQKLSLDANPVDVHRASDAVLAQLDHLAANHPNVLFIATSNFPDAIDRAFVSRADLCVNIGLPNAEICRHIIADTITKVSVRFPPLAKLLDDPSIDDLGSACYGLDGRRIRKAVISAMTFDKKTALDPGRLTLVEIAKSIEAAKEESE